MFTVRPANERGHANHGWLDTHYTFSFSNYYDPDHMGFHGLRVINDDRVEAGMGFGMHGHQDMEIVTYVLDGALEHRDSMGNGSVIRPGDVQRMSAGTGIRHSEFNPSASEPVHLLQIWLLPKEEGIVPSYEERHFSVDEKRGRLRLIASPGGRDGSVTIHTDASIYSAVLADGDHVEHALANGRHAWIHVARGSVRIGDLELTAGDGVAVSSESSFTLSSSGDSEVLVFDLA